MKLDTHHFPVVPGKSRLPRAEAGGNVARMPEIHIRGTIGSLPLVPRLDPRDDLDEPGEPAAHRLAVRTENQAVGVVVIQWIMHDLQAEVSRTACLQLPELPPALALPVDALLG